MTPEEKQAVDLVMGALDKLTDEWWKECGLDEAIASLSAMIPGPFKERAFDNMRGLLRQSFAEGMYRAVEEFRQQVADLERERDEANESVEALTVKLKILSAYHQTCACSYEHKDHICAHHSPAVTKAESQVRRLQLQNKNAVMLLRRVMNACANKPITNGLRGVVADWIKREGLEGSVLREQALAPAEGLCGNSIGSDTCFLEKNHSGRCCYVVRERACESLDTGLD